MMFSMSRPAETPKPACQSAPRTGELLRGGFFLSFLSVGTGAAAYSYQLFMGAILGPAEFAEFNVILAMAAVGGAPLAAVGTVAIRHLATVAAVDGIGAVRFLYRTWMSRAMLGLATIGVLVMAADARLTTALDLPDVRALWLLACIIGCNMISLCSNSTLTALHLFGTLGVLPLGSVLLKFGFGGLAVGVLGWGFHGALLADVLSNGATFLLAVCCIGFHWRGTRPYRGPTHSMSIGHVVPVAASLIGITSMQQIDILTVASCFNQTTAAEYVAAAVLGKAVLYLPSGIVTAILPFAAAAEARGDRSIMHAAAAIKATVLVCGGMAFGCWIFGRWLISSIYGDKYGAAGELLQLYAVAMVPMALVLILQRFFIARGQTAFCWVTAAAAALELLLLRAWHPSPRAIIGVLAVFNTLLAALGCFAVYIEIAKKSVISRE